MIYKNGIKEIIFIALFMGLIAGPIYGIFMGMVFQNMEMALQLGLGFAIAISIPFAILMIIINAVVEKKVVYLREELSKQRKIICEGPANHKQNNIAIGGWMFLTEDALEFYPHKMNVVGENIPILLDDILSVETKAKQLIIHTKKGSHYIFIVNKSKLWKKSITEEI